MTDHTNDSPPHTHGGTDAPECTTCRPAEPDPQTTSPGHLWPEPEYKPNFYRGMT